MAGILICIILALLTLIMAVFRSRPGPAETEIDYNLWTNYPTTPTYYSDTTLNGANLPITLTVTPTPEPSSLIVWGLGPVGLLAVARRRRRSA